MNYRDVVLKLLRKREQLSVMEDVILADFSNADDPRLAFEKWCDLYHIDIMRNSDTKSIVLQKKRR